MEKIQNDIIISKYKRYAADAIENNKSGKTINFIADIKLLEAFDKMCRANGSSRTKILHELMREYIVREIDNLEKVDYASKLISTKE